MGGKATVRQDPYSMRLLVRVGEHDYTLSWANQMRLGSVNSLIQLGRKMANEDAITTPEETLDILREVQVQMLTSGAYYIKPAPTKPPGPGKPLVAAVVVHDPPRIRLGPRLRFLRRGMFILLRDCFEDIAYVLHGYGTSNSGPG